MRNRDTLIFVCKYIDKCRVNLDNCVASVSFLAIIPLAKVCSLFNNGTWQLIISCFLTSLAISLGYWRTIYVRRPNPGWPLECNIGIYFWPNNRHTDLCIIGTGEWVSGPQLPLSMSLWAIYCRVELIVAVRHHSSHDVCTSQIKGFLSDHSPRQMSIAYCAVLV